jgi:F-type H+-transporting ATPase subunit b
VEVLAVVGGLAHQAAQAAASEGSMGISINLFWVIVAAGNFLVFFGLAWLIFFKPVSGRLADRRSRIEEGLRDAEVARREREQVALDRIEILATARREASDITTRAHKVSEESRDRDLVAAREELRRLHQDAAEEIEAEKQRALVDIRSEVADLALRAASRVVGETMTGERQQRLVDQFLAEVGQPSVEPGGSRG